jgi:hypothetical protein
VPGSYDTAESGQVWARVDRRCAFQYYEKAGER